MTTIERLAGKGIGAFIDEFELDLRRYEGKLVCLCGDNGEGKTTVLEIVPGAMYRTTPSQGPIYSLAGPGGGWIEIDAVTDQPYRIRQTLPAAGRPNSFVWDANGLPRINGGDVIEFDRWAKDKLPDPDVYFTSDFAAQGAAPFASIRRLIDERAAARKDVLLRALGVSYLEELAVLARNHATESDKKLSAAKASAAEAERLLQLPGEVYSDPKRLNAETSSLVENVQVRETESDAAMAAFNSAQTDLNAAMSLGADAKAKRDRVRDLSTRIESIVAQISEASEGHARAQAVLVRRHEVNQTQDRLRLLQDNLAQCRQLLLHERSRAADKHKKSAVEKAAADAATQRSKSGASQESISDLRAQLRQAAEATDRMPEHDRKYAAAKQLVDGLERRIDQLHRMTMHGAFDRIESLADGLDHVANWEAREGDAPETTERTIVRRIEKRAADVLWADTEAAHTANQAPKEMEIKRGELERAKRDLDAIAAARSADQLTSSRHKDLRQAIKQAEIAKREREEALLLAEGHAESAATANSEAMEAENTCRELSDRQPVLEAEIATLQNLLAETNIDRAQANADHLSKLAIKLEVEMDALVRQKQDLGDIPEDSAVADAEHRWASARQKASTAAEALRAAEGALERHREAIKVARANKARHAELTALVDRAAIDLSDWNRLGEELGKTGVQAMEIDAAGPELATKANELLHTCYGTRWTISISTSKAARGDVDGFYIQVSDTNRAREGFIESYSGGERVLLGEAIALAMTILFSTRNRTKRPTLIRDEVGAALSEQSAIAYVAMLRQAAAEIGAHCVLFVSHSKAVQEMSDVRVMVENGTLKVA